jgi:hypothetical protein
MFLMNLAKSVRIGDTVDCRINGQPARVTWRDAQTLVIEPDDARHIACVMSIGDLNHFVCADVDGYNDFKIITDRPGAWRKP